MNKKTLISIILLIEFCSLGYGQSKVSSTTVLTSSPAQKQGLLNVYSQGELIPPTNRYVERDNAQSNSSDDITIDKIRSDLKPKSDVTYSEPDSEERLKSKIDFASIKKTKYQKDTLLKDKNLNKYKRPSQFSDLIKNRPLLDKQNAAISLSNGRLGNNQLNRLISESSVDRNASFNGQVEKESSKNELMSKSNYSSELGDQFTQSLNYLIKYLNRQGQTKLINGTEQTKNANNILLKHARNLDRENCLLRLICEIGSNEEDASDNQLIKEIRLVFGNKHRTPVYPLKTKDSSFPFFYAGHVGATSGSAERCLEVFPECSARTDLLLQIVANANKYSLNKTKLYRKADKIMHNSKLEKELYPTSESRSFSEKMRNKMKKLHTQYIKKMN